MKNCKLLFTLLFCSAIAFTSCYDNADPNWDQTLGIKEKTNYLLYNDVEYEIVKITRLSDTEILNEIETPTISIVFSTDTNVSIQYKLYGYAALPYDDFSIVPSTTNTITCTFYANETPYILDSGMLTIEEAEEYGVKFTNYTFNHALTGFAVNGKAKDFSY
ncbi:MAG: hypothetical protein LBV02_04185 [Bacteroidales bacterium]|jgi:hypothetical protein|nr:hypothetical protein [Bacteroidales bacterium]